MKNFVFYNPTRIRFGKGRIADVAKEIAKTEKVLITFGGGSVKQNGVLDQILDALREHETYQFSGIEPNPSYETLICAVKEVREKDVSFLLAVGGGSVIDGTKFIAAAASYEGDPWKIVESGGSALKKALPLGAVVTLPASGSEANDGAVISRKETKTKLAFFSSLIRPRFAILDPTSTYSLPPSQTSNGIVDTYVHVMEQYMTYPVGGKIQDRLAEAILLTLIEEGPRAMNKSDDYESRANLMWCATLGLNGLIGAGVPQDWSTHMIGQELTALYGIDHARTLAIILPSLLYNRRHDKRLKLLQYAERVWNIESQDEDEKISLAIQKTRQFFESLGMKTRLRDYGLSVGAAAETVERLRMHHPFGLGENHDITPELAGQIVESSF